MPDGSYAVCSTKLEHLSVGVDLCSQAFIALCVAACTVYFCFVLFFFLFRGGARESLWRRRRWCCFVICFSFFAVFRVLLLACIALYNVAEIGINSQLTVIS